MARAKPPLLALIFLCAGVMGCHKKYTTCTVEDKYFVPAHVKRWTTDLCVSRDVRSQCTLYIPVHHSSNIPDKWFLKFACGTYEIEKRVFEHTPVTMTHEH